MAAAQVKSFEVVVTVLMLKEEQYHVAYCPALELSSYGETEQEAKSAFEEAMTIFVEETDRKGTLEKVLLKLGWTLQQLPELKYTPPVVRPKDVYKYVISKQAKVIEENVAIPY